MDVIPESGRFMPPEFWFALAVLFGTAFVALLIWTVNRFLLRLEVTIDRLEKNQIIQDSRLVVTEKRLDQHDKDFDLIYETLAKTVKKK